MTAGGIGHDGRPRVMVAGGGFAALEAILALRALAGDAVAVELVSLHQHLAYRPAATVEPFAGAARLEYDLAAIALDLGVRHRVDRLEAVASKAHRVRLGSGAQPAYDFLVLAVGAQLRTSIAGALMFTGPRDEPYVRELLADLGAGAVSDVVFAVPEGVSWPLPLYELALLTAGYAAQRGWSHARISIVTPERDPLEVLGERGSALVRQLLGDHGVRFLGSRTPERYDRNGRLALRFGGDAVDADRVIAAPNMVGRAIGGVPQGRSGFTPTDVRGRVDGVDDVYAAGDMTTCPVKHGGLAAQQADAVAADIAARLGFPAEPRAATRVLSVRLAGAAHPVELHATLDATGRAVAARIVPLTAQPPDAESAPRPSKVFGRHLTPYLATREQTTVTTVTDHSPGAA